MSWLSKAWDSVVSFFAGLFGGGAPSHDDYAWGLNAIKGYGPVYAWPGVSAPTLCKELVKAGCTWTTIELLCGWAGRSYYKDPGGAAGPYRKLLAACRAVKVVLHVSICNDNKGQGKYGDDHKGLDQYGAALDEALAMVISQGHEGVVVQPVGETQTPAGIAFQTRALAKLKAKGFKTCWNHGSRPTSNGGCTYFAYHPASVAVTGAAGGITLTDHSTPQREMNVGGGVFAATEPAKLAAYAKRVRAAGRGFVHYGLSSGIDKAAIRGLKDA